MVLTDGKDIVINKEGTFGTLKFAGLKKEKKVWDNEAGEMTDVIKKRDYMLRSSAQQKAISVSLPPEVELKKIPLGTEVTLVNPVVTAFTTGRNTIAYLVADDIVPVSGSGAVPGSVSKNENKPGNQK